MKQPSNAAHDACEALRTVNCPVGCTECPYDNDRFSARFSKTRLQERHWLPGEGKIAWPRVLDALRAVDYRGVWLYEIGFACPKTIFRDRPLTCADFARNAQELFAGKAPTVFSTPKPNLGMRE